MWYVDFGASNHMTGHANWFESLKEPEVPGYVQVIILLIQLNM